MDDDPTTTDDGGDELDRLVAACLDRAEREGRGAIDAVCAEHPHLADALRERIELLESSGLWAPPVPEWIPDRLGDFDLVRRLGEGGMGVVYLAEQASLGRLVALKVVRPTQLYFPGTRERFQREVSVVARLQHPNIVPIHTVGEADGLPYFAMEFVEGCSLDDVLARLRDRAPSKLTGEHLSIAVASLSPRDSTAHAERRAAPPAAAGDARDARRASAHAQTTETEASDVDRRSWIEAALDVAIQVAEALAHAHERGIVHRDVKPANVLLTSDGVARLTDFGLAKVDDPIELSRTGQMIGTPYTMSPEQVRGETVDERTDVYSLGVVLYELLTLTTPFAGADADEVFACIRGSTPTPPRRVNAQVPPDLEAVCLKAIEKAPDARYASMADLADDLRRARRGEPTRARPLSLPARVARAPRALGAAVLQWLVVAVLAGWWALDVLALTPLTDADPTRYAARYAGVVVATLLLAWVAGALAHRLRPTRGAALGALAALLLGVSGLVHVDDARREQHFLAEKTALAAAVDFELRTAGFVDASLFGDYTERFAPRFDVDDSILAALVHSKAFEYDVARGFLEDARAREPDHAAIVALDVAMAEVVGDDDRFTRATRRLAELADDDPEHWRIAGDVLSLHGHVSLALDAYHRASRGTDNALRDQLNLRLVHTYCSLCRADAAMATLQPYLVRGDDSPEVLVAQIRTEAKAPDLFDVTPEELAARIDAIADAPWMRPFVLTKLREWATDADPALFDDLLALAEAFPDDPSRLFRAAGKAHYLYDPRAAMLYARLGELGERLGDDRAVARAEQGHAVVALRERRFDDAARHARRATQLVPSSDAHSTLAIAELQIALAAGGAPSEAVWQAFVDELRLAVDALDHSPKMLNNLASALVSLHGFTGDDALLDEALALTRRSERRLDRAGDASACPSSEEDGRATSQLHDVRSEIAEVRGDVETAIAEARRAFDAAPDDLTRFKRSTRLEALEAGR